MKTVIFHIDVNSAFLSWTAVERLRGQGDSLDLRQVPAVIAGDAERRHGIVLAKSAPAKARGVQTGEPLWQAEEKCPGLLVSRPDYALYVQQSRLLLRVLRETAPAVEQYSIDEAWADMSGTRWSRGDPAEAADRLRQRIKEELGFTVNIGVSSNKLLAKMAGDFQKPDRVHTLFPGEIEEKMWPLPVRDLFGIGPATERKLARFGIHTIGEIAVADPAFLRARFGKQGEYIWHASNGRCSEIVNPETALNKGYGNSVTTDRDVCDRESAHRVLLSLCETAGMRMRRDGQSAGVVAVHIRDGQFRDVSHQRQLMAPSSVTRELWEAACRCFDELWNGRTPLRQLGVQFSRVSPDTARQRTLFDERDFERLERLDRAVDSIREKYGEGALCRACFLHGDVAPMGGGLSKERRTGITKPV